MTNILHELTPREKELLPTAERFIANFVVKNGRLPGRRVLTSELQCRDSVALNVRAELVRTGRIAIPADSVTDSGDIQTIGLESRRDVDETHEHLDNDNVWNIGLPKTDIRTLEQLVEYCKIDLNVWTVAEFVVNKWSMGFVSKAVKTETVQQEAGKPDAKVATKTFEGGSQPLYQVKARLVRKELRKPDVIVEDNARLLRQLSESKRQLAGQRQYVSRLARNHVGSDDLLVNIKEFMETFSDWQLPQTQLQARVPLVAPAVREGHTEDVIALWSDFHFGDRIKREDTSGFPEYNLAIGANRFGYVVKKTKQCLALHRAMYPLKRLYIWLGGDMGNGILHDSPNSNDLFPPAQVHFTYNMIKFGIEDLLTLTEPDEHGTRVLEEIVLLGTVGNHMRMDEKMPHKYQAQRTLDWLIYQFVFERFGSHPNVRIRQEMSPYIFENIRGHRHMFAHGMQVGYRNSPDAQCKSMGSFIDKTRALFDSPEWRRKNNLQGSTFARVCIGDIHVPVSFPRLVSNGSLNGQNELGVNWMLEPIPAGQQLFGVSDNHQETWKYFIDCSHVQERKQDFNQYGHFAADYLKKLGR